MVVYSDRPYEPVCTKGRNSYSVLTLLGNKQGVLRLTVCKIFGFKKKTVIALGFLQRKTLISASAVPHRGGTLKGKIQRGNHAITAKEGETQWFKYERSLSGQMKSILRQTATVELERILNLGLP